MISANHYEWGLQGNLAANYNRGRVNHLSPQLDVAVQYYLQRSQLTYHPDLKNHSYPDIQQAAAAAHTLG